MTVLLGYTDFSYSFYFDNKIYIANSFNCIFIFFVGNVVEWLERRARD